jgi:hypothetical protein
MSKRNGILGWKHRQQIDYEPTGNEQAWSGELDWQYDDSTYPGFYTEDFHSDAQNYPTFVHPVGTIRDDIDWEIGGLPGLTKWVGTTGVVESSNVDAHDFTGEMAYVRRHNVDMSGPVGSDDYNSLLALLYATQESNAFFPNEVSQADMIRGV